MNEAEVTEALDAHDALLAACVDGTVSFDEFILAYGNFPDSYGLKEDAGTGTHTIVRLFRMRIAFHKHVSGVLSGFRQSPEPAVSEELRVFMHKAIMLRLRTLVSRYPDFRAESLVVRDPFAENLVRDPDG
jgi:hypothetical protein